MRSASAFYNLPPPLPSFQYLILFYAWAGNLWISISNGYLKIWISGFQITVILELDDISSPPPPHNHQKMKCSSLDYVQLLMISQAIKWWKSTKMWKKRLPKSSKHEMLIFWLCSTSDDRPSNPSNESQPKCKKKGSLSYQKMKCLFLDYVQLLMIGQAIQAKKSTKMQKKVPKSSKNEMLIFGLCSTSDNWPSNPNNESWQKCTTEVPQNTWNNQFCLIHNFSNVFPLKWFRMTQNKKTLWYKGISMKDYTSTWTVVP